MVLGSPRRTASVAALLASLAVLPGVVIAQPVGPSTVTETSQVVRALGSFGLVGLVGAAYLTWSRSFVDRSVDDTMSHPTVAVVYGLLAFVIVLVLGFYANDLLGRAGMAATPLGYIALAILLGGVVLVGALGHLVVGVILTDLFGGRRPWRGLVVGAAISAVGWLAIPAGPAMGAWVLVAAVGVGGRTRTWVHSERTVDSEVDA